MRSLLTSLLLAATASLFASDSGGSLGKKEPGLLNLKGTIYALPQDTESMPSDLESRKPIGVIYTDRLDVPPRDFTSGFPGVTDRFEWFGVVYTGTFEISNAGTYRWRLVSDDGSRLWIDGKEIIDNDGVHGFDPQEGEVHLAQGPHAMRLWYFQGPATEIGLQLFVTPPGGQEQIFALSDYAAGLSSALQSVDARATREGIRVNLDAAVLFDTNRHDLKPRAKEAIASVVKVIAAYPKSAVEISGHTDSVGETEPNQKLSERRAEAVRAALESAGLPGGVRLTTTGFGESQPIATNETEKGRALNRRVEILIRP
jgi:outer membrane protein OmpA-like peptidoglycan-associated protein